MIWSLAVGRHVTRWYLGMWNEMCLAFDHVWFSTVDRISRWFS